MRQVERYLMKHRILENMITFHLFFSFLFFQAKTLNYGGAKQIILSVMEELHQSQDEKSFEKIFQTITMFCQQNQC